MYQKIYSKLMRCLETYFLIEIYQEINVRINYLFFIIILNFLFLQKLLTE